MNKIKEELLRVYFDGHTYSFSCSPWQPHNSMYGGPLEDTISGCTFGPRKLHRVAELSSGSFPEFGARHIFSLPLIYGFTYDGCSLKYRLDAGKIELLRITPSESSEDYPYPDYPVLLPYLSIASEPPRAESWEQFVEQLPNMSSFQPAELVAVAKPAFTIGHSMWGKFGDFEGVSVVFSCDLKTKSVHAYNVCG
jgi:hypothetical protein